DATLLQDEWECRDRDRFHDGTDDMQAAVRRERADHSVPLQLHVDCAYVKFKVAPKLADCRRVFARDDAVRPETLGFIELALARRERCHVTAVGGGELKRHMSPTADTADAYSVSPPGVHR